VRDGKKNQITTQHNEAIERKNQSSQLTSSRALPQSSATFFLLRSILHYCFRLLCFPFSLFFVCYLFFAFLVVFTFKTVFFLLNLMVFIQCIGREIFRCRRMDRVNKREKTRCPVSQIETERGHTEDSNRKQHQNNKR